MVIFPTLLTSVDGVRELMEHVEVQALGNMDPHIHFAVLGDFADAPRERMPEDEEILEAARAGILDLNRRHGQGRGDRFFLFHRAPPLEPRRRVVDGLGAQARQDRGVQPPPARGHGHELRDQVGDLSVLPLVRYCITLDSDTRLPRETARELIGIIHHPLNRPHFEPRAPPRHRGLRHPPAPRERDHVQRLGVALRAALRRPHRRRPLHHRGVRHVPGPLRRRHLHGEGALRRGRLHGRARGPRARERAALARPLRGPATPGPRWSATSRSWTTIPSSVLAHARRQHRWVRGDWQILFWLFPIVPTRAGLERNRLPLISRWKILDNLRRSLVAPAVLAAAGRGLDGPARPAGRLDGGGGGGPGLPGLSALPAGPARAAAAAAGHGLPQAPGRGPEDGGGADAADPDLPAPTTPSRCCTPSS